MRARDSNNEQYTRSCRERIRIGKKSFVDGFSRVSRECFARGSNRINTTRCGTRLFSHRQMGVLFDYFKVFGIQ